MNATQHVFTVHCIFQIVDYGATVIRLTLPNKVSNVHIFIPKFNASKRRACEGRGKPKGRCLEVIKYCLFNMQIEPIRFNRDESIYLATCSCFLLFLLSINIDNNTPTLESLLCALCKLYSISFVAAIHGNMLSVCCF